MRKFGNTGGSESNMRIKVAVGYLLVAVAAVFTVWYIYMRIAPLAVREDATQGAAYRKVLVTGTTISSLYEASYRANIYLQDPSVDNLEAYDRAIDTVYGHIDSLCRLQIPPEQIGILEEITELLKWKKSNLIGLAATMSRLREREVLRHDSLLRALERKDTLSPVVVVIEKPVHKDTIRLVPSERDRFWRRFAGPLMTARDTLKEMPRSSEMPVDTLAPVVSQRMPSDVGGARLQAKPALPSRRRDRTSEAIRQQQHTLMLIDQTINDRATLLLQKMNDENIRAALDEIGTRDRTLKRAGESVLGIALGALCIVLLFVALIFSDINKSKRYKQALEEARRKAEDLMENRQRLLLSISHDIRSPLNSIMGYVELLSSNPSPDKVARYTASMRYSSAHLMELLTNLLEYSRIETGKMTLDAAPFEVFPLFDQTLGMFVPSAERKGVSLVSDNRAEKGMYVKADAARIRQVLINLLSNAVKFTDRGSVTLSAVVRSGDGNGAPLRLEFAVSDTGCGIAPEEQKRIFDEFSRADTAGKEGSGFGLAVVSRLVELLGGTLELDSRIGEGSVFRVSIPVLSVSVSEIPKPVPAEAPPRVTPRSILVVEDDPSQRAMLSEILKSAGHRVCCCDRLEQCVDKLADVDMVLTDIQLGGFSGYQLLSAIRSASEDWARRLPVIAVSASDRLEKESDGFDAVLRKPFTQSELLKTIAGMPSPDPGYDLGELREMMNGDEEAVRTVVETFVSSTRDSLKLLEEYEASRDWPSLAKLAHRMLPMFRQLHADRTAADLEELEKSGSSAEPARISFLVERAIGSAKRILGRMSGSL